MAVTASRLRAVVSADTEQASQKMRDFGRTVNDTAKSSQKDLSGLASLVKGDFTGALGALGVSAGVVTTVAVLGKMAIGMDDARQKAANMRRELTAYAGSAAEAEAATQALIRATDGGLSRLDATAQASRLLSMGLADTATEAGQLARMAVMLGDKTMNAQQRMESFNAMLANQSIERLDTFGISSGRARQRIEELQAAMPGLSREQAFVNTVLEIGADKLRDVEAEGVTAATSLEKLGAAVSDLRAAAADKIHVQIVVDTITQGISNAAYAMSDQGAAERAYGQAFEQYRQAVERTNKAQADLSGWYAKINPLARTNYEIKLEEAQAAEAQALAEYEVAQMLMQVADGTYSADDAGRTYIETMRDTVPAAYAAAAAMDATAVSARKAALARGAYLTQMGKKYLSDREAARLEEGSYGHQMTEFYKKVASGTRSQSEIDQLIEDWKNKVKDGNTEVSADAGRKMSDALSDASNDFKTAMQQGMNFSIGLSDLRPGGAQGPNAPGQNGAFEDIYRLQAFVQNGTWGETANKYGLDQAGAKDLVSKFQQGIWDESVKAAIDMTKLTEQIQQAQLGKTLMDAVAADLAKETQGDPKIIKAMLGLGGGTDGGTGNAQLGTTAIAAMLQGIDASLASTGGTDLTKRGELAWEKMETGFVDKASKSIAFATAVEKMVENSLKQYLPTN